VRGSDADTHPRVSARTGGCVCVVVHARTRNFHHIDTRHQFVRCVIVVCPSTLCVLCVCVCVCVCVCDFDQCVHVRACVSIARISARSATHTGDTVIHRGGMVVRNGTAPDLVTLLEAMANEPVED
jgi:hypothetical protein